MKSINILTLKPNTFFNAPVYLEKDYILLCPETPVSESLISRLKRWNYTVIYSEGELHDISQAMTALQNQAQIASLDKNIQHQEQEKEFLGFYQSLIQYMEESINIFIKKNSIDIEGITQKIKEAIEKIKKDRDMLLRLLINQYDNENFFILHCVHTTLLSLAIGDFIKLPPHRMIELGLAAFLHELGMFKIPNFLVLNQKTDLTPDEKKNLLAHTVLGYRLLKGYSLNENIALAALEHHEKWDGTGYPKRLKGDTITLYARIIAITCHYESRFARYTLRQELFSFADLIKSSRSFFDEKILKAFILCLSLFPLGSHVLLNNGAKAIVYKANPENPQCPQVRLIVDKDGNRVTSHILVDTSLGQGISISRILPLAE